MEVQGIQDILKVPVDTGYTRGTGGYRIYWRYQRIQDKLEELGYTARV